MQRVYRPVRVAERPSEPPKIGRARHILMTAQPSLLKISELGTGNVLEQFGDTKLSEEERIWKYWTPLRSIKKHCTAGRKTGQRPTTG